MIHTRTAPGVCSLIDIDGELELTGSHIDLLLRFGIPDADGPGQNPDHMLDRTPVARRADDHLDIDIDIDLERRHDVLRTKVVELDIR